MEQLSIYNNNKETYLVENFSADSFHSEKYRQILENKYSSKLEITDRFNRQSVSYQLSKKDVLHSWLKYKEGFSANLVNAFIDDMNVGVGDWIMDPFFGSGTTGLVSQMRGINCVGFDILPISEVAIKAKANVYNYDLDEIKTMLAQIKELTVPLEFDGKTPYIGITEHAYPLDTERFLAYIAYWSERSNFSSISKNLLTLCIINSLERISFTIKSGQYLGWDSRSLKVQKTNEKRVNSGKKEIPAKKIRDIIGDPQNTIIVELDKVIRDIELIQRSSESNVNAEIQFIKGSALYELPKFEDNILKGVITSPPYCNRYDYTRTYALELVYLGLGEKDIKKMRQSLLSCTVENKSKIDEMEEFYKSIGQHDRFKHIKLLIDNNEAFQEVMNAMNARSDNGDLNNLGVVRMVEGYFTELAFIYAELYRVSKKGAKIVFVNDNVRYGGEVIPVDFLSCEFAEQFGFKVDKIYALKQQKGNSSQQMAKFGRVALRKSITVWSKE